MRNEPKLVFLIFLLCAVGACEDLEGGTFCSHSVEPAVVVVVRDAQAGSPIGERASGFVRDGTYVDSLKPYTFRGDGTMLSFRAADERPGTYEVVVEREGYVEWHESGVVVFDGDCHVETITVFALMDSVR